MSSSSFITMDFVRCFSSCHDLSSSFDICYILGKQEKALKKITEDVICIWVGPVVPVLYILVGVRQGDDRVLRHTLVTLTHHPSCVGHWRSQAQGESETKYWLSNSAWISHWDKVAYERALCFWIIFLRHYIIPFWMIFIEDAVPRSASLCVCHCVYFYIVTALLYDLSGPMKCQLCGSWESEADHGRNATPFPSWY